MNIDSKNNKEVIKKRPNVLFLMSDEHRADLCGWEDNDIIRMPTLNQLASEAVVFRNAYTPSPVCIPARQAMMAGQFPWTCDCPIFGDDLTPGYMTFARRFSEYGYHTVCCGKLHHCGADQMQGWKHRPIGDLNVSDRYTSGFSKDSIAGLIAEEGIGKWSNQKEIERAGVGLGPCEEQDQGTVDVALRYIRNYFCDSAYDRPQSHRPIFLKVSLIQPHYPFFTDKEKFEYYLNRVPIFNEERFDHPRLSRTQCGPDITASARDRRRATAAYYGMVETIDGQYKRVIEQLEAVGQDLDDWIIIYTSDHGDMLGEHGIWEKLQFFEGAVRVPLFIRWPKGIKKNGVVSENVNLCDLFATLCDLCDLPVPDGLDSRSLRKLLTNDEKNWDNEVVSQYNEDLMIKQDALKYISYKNPKSEVLFDLQADPKESRNLIDEPQYADAVSKFHKRENEIKNNCNQ